MTIITENTKYSMPGHAKKYDTKEHVLDQSSITPTNNWNDAKKNLR